MATFSHARRHWRSIRKSRAPAASKGLMVGAMVSICALALIVGLVLGVLERGCLDMTGSGIASAEEAGVTITLPSASSTGPMPTTLIADSTTDIAQDGPSMTDQVNDDPATQAPASEDVQGVVSDDQEITMAQEDQTTSDDHGKDVQPSDDEETAKAEGFNTANADDGDNGSNCDGLVTASIQDGLLRIHISDEAFANGPLTLIVGLPDGIKTSPGIYAHASNIDRLEPSDNGEAQTLSIALTGGGDLALDLVGTDSMSQIPISLVSNSEVLATLQAGTPSTDEANETIDAALASPKRVMRVAAATTQATTQNFKTNGYYHNAPTEHQIPKIIDSDTGEVAYCNDMNLNAPGDPQHGSVAPVSYTNWSFSSDSEKAASQGQNLLDFLLFHGYPIDPTIGGLCSNADDAQSATQWAIWYFTNEGSSPAYETSKENWSDEFWAAYNWLIASANAYNQLCLEQGAENQPEYGTCQVWSTPKGSLQNLVTAKPRVGWIDLIKTSANASVTNGSALYSLTGAIYDVLDASGSVAATITTDADGKATAQLAVGTYTVIEKSAPTGYELSQDTLNVTVTGGPVHVSVQASDIPILGSLSITKTDGSEQPVALAGATFELTPQDGGAVVATLVTDGNGQASTTAVLPLGSYVLTETIAPKGYLAIDPIDITISQETPTVHLDLVDTPDIHDVTLYKRSALDGAPLAGARFELLKPKDGATVDMGSLTEEQISNGALWDVVANAESQTEGALTFTGLSTGSYVLVESAAPTGYESIDGGWKLTLKQDGSFDLGSIGQTPAALTIDGSYAITNTPIVELPSAGGTTHQRIAIITSGFATVAAAASISIYMIARNRKYLNK